MLCVLLFALLAISQAAPVKHLAGPPSEFATHRIPEVSSVETLERSSSRNIWFDTEAASSVLATHTFPVESATKFVLSFASPVEGLTLELLTPAGKPANARIEKQSFRIDDDAKDNIPVTAFVVEDALVGVYTFTISTNAQVDKDLLTSVVNNPRPDAILTFIVDDNLTIRSHLQSFHLKVGQEVGVVATITPSATSGYDANLLGVSSAVMEVILPDGTSVDLTMHDDGLTGGDMVANDKSFSANMKVTQPGVYILGSVLDGELDMTDETTTDAFQRSSQHVVVVSGATVEIGSKAILSPMSDSRSLINIAVTNVETEQPPLRAYAEVYGTAADGSKKPAAWIGGLVEIAEGFIGLELPLDFLQIAGVSGPLYLNNVYLSDLHTSFPVAISTEEIEVSASNVFPRHWGFQALSNMTITREMRVGVNPLPKVAKVEGVPDLLLLPGYCTDENPWARGNNAAKFTNGFFPVDRGNYANHEYATRILALVEAQGMTSYGVIAHSQGGMVSTHIHNYFFSGLESATGGRLIQSVGTPYNGNTAAGSAANLGQIFGIGCGASTDLSRDGAVNWLSGISSTTRADVNYYTTTYKQGTWFGDYCSLPMNMVLQWPNDGVTELTYAQLPGAVNRGNTEKWCHSTEMGYPPQSDDATRNQAMNAAAAR
eukprot:TRINITY_DN0_c1_g1_i1.p1 TRINITY_DN0_c1_g1~~TRINITY_DN0_c1_g1_i1.p1  ORF type:complete len:659 (+),score=192.57 TRINITY_DN0_c1_g1_i1:13-1989(+)